MNDRRHAVQQALARHTAARVPGLRLSGNVKQCFTLPLQQLDDAIHQLPEEISANAAHAGTRFAAALNRIFNRMKYHYADEAARAEHARAIGHDLLSLTAWESDATPECSRALVELAEDHPALRGALESLHAAAQDAASQLESLSLVSRERMP